MLSDRQNSSYAKSTVNSIYIHLINIERVSEYSVTIRGLRVVSTCRSWAWSNRTSPSKWEGLGSLLAACSVYGDLTCSVHTVNNVCMFNCQCHFYLCNQGPYVRLAFVPNMLPSWNKDIIIIIIIIIKGRWPWNLVCSIEYWSTTKYIQMITLGWPWLILRQVRFGPLCFCMGKS